MTIQVRGATSEDYTAMRETINDAFGNTDDEVGILDYLVANDSTFTPDCARIALLDGEVVAITVVVPRQIRTRKGWLAGAELTLVGCRTALQGRGFGSMVFRDALAYVRDRGMALGIFYGEPDYYPRFGCAPVLARHRATLETKAYRERLSAARKSERPEDAAPKGPVNLKPASPSDTPALIALFNKDMGAFTGSVSRLNEAWEWTPRDLSAWQVLTLPGTKAYAVTALGGRQDALYVDDAGAEDPASALRLVEGLVTLAEEKGFPNLRVVVPPTHPVHRAMRVFGAESSAPPAGPGFAVITRWEDVLPAGYRRIEEGLALDGRLVLKAGTIPLTQLVMGYRDVDDLMYLPEVSLPASQGDAQRPTEQALAILRKDFPRETPTYMYAPFYRLH